MHLKENKLVAFQFRTLCLEPDIQQLAREAVKEKCTNQVLSLISNTFLLRHCSLAASMSSYVQQVEVWSFLGLFSFVSSSKTFYCQTKWKERLNLHPNNIWCRVTLIFCILFKEEAKKIDRAYEAKKVIRQSVKDLERDGLVYFKDSSKDLYEVTMWWW